MPTNQTTLTVPISLAGKSAKLIERFLIGSEIEAEVKVQGLNEIVVSYGCTSWLQVTAVENFIDQCLEELVR